MFKQTAPASPWQAFFSEALRLAELLDAEGNSDKSSRDGYGLGAAE